MGSEEGGDLGQVDQSLELAPNATGFAESFHTAGTIDHNNPFFTPNGGNGRTCETCHQSNQGWTLTPDKVSQLFDDTGGTDLLFMTLDEGSRPDNDISTLAARKKAFKSTLIKHAVTRFPSSVPATAEFTVTAVADPSGFGTTAGFTIFRRPTPTVNEAKVANTNWAFVPADFGGTDVPSFLPPNAQGASFFHLQNPTLPADLAQQMATFQLGLFFAQSFDNKAGALDVDGAKGGPANLAAQPFSVGINDIQSASFTRKVFNIYDAWKDADANKKLKGDEKKKAQAKAAIFRGQEIFNFFEFNVTGVNGFNDLLGKAVVRGTCSTCHNSPNVGGHSVPRFFDVGTADAPNCLSDYPVMTFQNKTTHAVRRVCDGGRALSGVFIPPSGKWSEIGAFRAPPLRGLAARAPYFHDGQAKDIAAVVKYFDKRFNMYLSSSQKSDLEAFLSAL